MSLQRERVPGAGRGEAGHDGPSPGQRPGSGALRLIFFTSPTSGPSRRMDGLVAWVKVTRKAVLTVVEADLERHAPLASTLGVSQAPTLVLVRDGVPVARHVGRATGREIDHLLRPWLEPIDAHGARAAATPRESGGRDAARAGSGRPAPEGGR